MTSSFRLATITTGDTVFVKYGIEYNYPDRTATIVRPGNPAPLLVMDDMTVETLDGQRLERVVGLVAGVPAVWLASLEPCTCGGSRTRPLDDDERARLAQHLAEVS